PRAAPQALRVPARARLADHPARRGAGAARAAAASLRARRAGPAAVRDRLPALGLRRPRPRVPGAAAGRPAGARLRGPRATAVRAAGPRVKHVVGPAAEIPPGGRRIVTLEGRSIGVFNVGGEFFALRNACPHQGGPLCQGVLSGFAVPGAPGEYRYVRRGGVLRCPWRGGGVGGRARPASVGPAPSPRAAV